MEERPFEDHDHESRRKDHCSKRRMILDPGSLQQAKDQRLAYLTTQSLTLALKASWSVLCCSAASRLSGSSKLSRSEKSEERPHSTSLSRLVGAQPRPSTEWGRRRERQICPSSEMLGCQRRVRQVTEGGRMLYSTGTLTWKRNLPPCHQPSSGEMVMKNSWRRLGSSNFTLQCPGLFSSISCTSFT